MAKLGRPWNQTNYASVKRFYKSYPKMYLLLDLSHCVKSYGHLCQILAFLPLSLTKYGQVT